MRDWLFPQLQCVAWFVNWIFCCSYLIFRISLLNGKCFFDRRHSAHIFAILSIKINFLLDFLNEFVTLLIIFLYFKLMIAFESPEFIDVRCLRLRIGGFSNIKQIKHFFKWIKQKNVSASIEIGRFHDPRVG